MYTSLRIALTGALLAIALTACSPAQPSAQPSETAPLPTATASPKQEAPVGFAITSPDFADGEDLEAWTSANAFGGQCSGDNINPALAWQELPEGTVAVAITMLDASAGNFVHWVHTDIPVDVTSVERGASAILAGVPGRNQADSEHGYFGPCPPGPNHRYVFTVWALDAATGLEPGFSYYDWLAASSDHVLGSADITGMYHGSS